MDWKDDEDVCAFLQCVRSERAHMPQRGHRGGCDKWQRVHQALVKAFPSRRIQEPGTLKRCFNYMRVRVADIYPRRCDKMTKSEKAMYDLMQDLKSGKNSPAFVLKERQNTIASTIAVQNKVTGKLTALRQCNEQALCAILQILRTVKVHQFEAGIGMTPKWELVHQMLSRTFPKMTMPQMETLKQHHYVPYFQHIADKFGASGQLPADLSNVLESEKLACQMLAEDTSHRGFKPGEVKVTSTTPQAKPPPRPSLVRGKRRTLTAASDIDYCSSSSDADTDSDYFYEESSGDDDFIRSAPIGSHCVVRPIPSRTASSTNQITPASAIYLQETAENGGTCDDWDDLQDCYGGDYDAASQHNYDDGYRSDSQSNSPIHAAGGGRKRAREYHHQDAGGNDEPTCVDMVPHIAALKLKILGRVALEQVKAETKRMKLMATQVDLEAKRAVLETRRLDVELERIKLQQMMVEHKRVLEA